MRTVNLTALVVLLTIFVHGSVSIAEESAPQNTFGISKLSSLEFDTANTDFTLLGDKVGMRRIVALGEANHTNGSFHMAMARMAKYLVETKNFRVILIETARLPSRILDQYIHDCSEDADPLKGLNNIFPQFASGELERLWLWLRNFNCTHLNDQVSLAGFDVQQGWDDSVPSTFDVVALENFVNSEVFSLKPRLADLRLCGPVPNRKGVRGPANQDELNRCYQFLDALEPFIRKSGVKERELESSVMALRSSAEVTLAYAHKDDFLGDTVRDAGMAQMVKYLLHGQFWGKKAVLIAHEGHVARNFQEYSPFTKKNMGTFLGEIFGPNYFVVAAISFKPAKADWWNGEGPLPVFPNDSTEGILFDSGIGTFVLDTHHNSIFKPTDTFEPGLPAYETMSRFVDAFVFIPTSHAMTNIPGVTTYPQ